ncbi:NAD-dependent DNA ligase LigA [Prevotella sp. tf2-5]|uniref:NAD-dependent DNA ligase LigA n=1 Tax=Prevotella sp. tf2-5 TaxID=1761889 RepID=UPI0008DF0422|nr:NAD-dependent DNA ligase LigA [Prevotella sp. tf2-5]SFO63912.1 DNA ligase (NAD+) [Prevotella sp. tf2-5]
MVDDKISRMQQLVRELNEASDAYYNGRGERMTDYEWDARFDELKRLEQETGTTLPDSPTQKVSEDTITGQKEEHEFAALSLAKTKQPAELVKWSEERPIWISWKLDGLTLVVTYDNGQLTKVVTRGNGHIGTNITHLSKAINGIPQNIGYKGHTVIRGEAVISYDDFDRFLIESGEDYANPRNLASGSLTLKDVEEVRQRHIQWIPFTLVYLDDDIPSWGDRMDWLEQQGFHTVEHRLIEHPDLSSVESVIDVFTEEVTSKKNPFPVDGLVICYDDTVYARTGSITGHHATKAGLAFKWQDEAAETVLQEIEWSCAASTISPVAIFRPVELEGTTVKRASLCNISECERLGIGAKGTEISVIKANKIIPKVIKVIRTEGVLEIPHECPVCHAATEIRVSEASGTKTLHCTNTECPAKQLKKFARFVSKEGMNIDGISEQTLSKFINLGWISEYADIYDLRQHIRELANMEGFGEKSASNIMRSIDRSAHVEAHRLLYALNIPLCGLDVCKRLLSAYPLDELVAMTQPQPAVEADLFAPLTSDTSPLTSIAGIGPEKSASFINWFRDARNRLRYHHLLEKLQVTQVSNEPTGNMCEGLTFVVTGDVHHYKNRNELKAYIESQGGKVASAVSGSTSYLINNDVTSTSGKNQKAQQLGIPILSEDEFVERFTDQS